MAKVTSSRDRSKRTASKRPTSSATRATRSKASTNSSRMTESGKGVTKGSAAARVTSSSTAKPAAPAKPAATAAGSGRTPRAITNGRSPAMRQIRAKAVQANRQAQGKPVIGGTKGRALTLPNSARAGTNLIKATADKARAAAGGGGLKPAGNFRAPSIPATARTATTAASRAQIAAALLRRSPHAAAAWAGINAGSVADGTLKGKLVREIAAGAKPRASKAENATKGDFGKSFKAARAQGSKVFMWKGKKYTTKRKDGK